MQNLGVKIVTGKALDANTGLTIKGLRNEGYEAFFIGIGKSFDSLFNKTKTLLAKSILFKIKQIKRNA